MRKYRVNIDYYVAGKLIGSRTFEYDTVEEARKCFNDCKVRKTMYAPKIIGENALDRMAPFEMILEMVEIAISAVTVLDTYRYEGGTWYVQNFGKTFFQGPQEQ